MRHKACIALLNSSRVSATSDSDNTRAMLNLVQTPNFVLSLMDAIAYTSAPGNIAWVAKLLGSSAHNASPVLTELSFAPAWLLWQLVSAGPEVAPVVLDMAPSVVPVLLGGCGLRARRLHGRLHGPSFSMSCLPAYIATLQGSVCFKAWMSNNLPRHLGLGPLLTRS